MELAVVILILLLLVAGGTAALFVVGGGTGPAGISGWANRRLPRTMAQVRTPHVIDVAPEETKPVVRPLAAPSREETLARLDELSAELRATVASGDDRLVRLHDQVEALRQGLNGRLEQIGHEVHDRWGEMAARQDAAAERLRADLVAQMLERDQQSASRRYLEQRAEVTADLYALLARLEAAIAAVTNPILLPGEPYSPPSEFLAESLVWENWKDVGERAFAFADAYSARRLHLSDSTRGEVGVFVTELRGLLTVSIYPNLRPNPTQAQLQTLRQALEVLAERFPRLRDSFERDFQEIAEATSRPGSEPPARDQFNA